MIGVRGGYQQLKAWITNWCNGIIPEAAASLWTQQCVAPLDCGRRKDEPDRRKLRPIALEEALLKFAESVACTAAAKQIEKAMEPRQLGAGTADGALLVLGVLKGWTEEATKQQADTIDPKQAKFIFSSDLRNAYGQVHKSALL